MKRIEPPEINRLLGYLAAAQHVFTQGEIDVTLDAALFETANNDVTDEDVIRGAYPEGYNPIEYRAECSLDEMISGVHRVLRVTKEFWKPEYSIAEIIE